VKSSKPQAKDKREKRNKHTKKFLPSSVQLDLLWGRDWSLQSTINGFLQRDANGLQEISFNKLPKNNPNFYPFSQSHQWIRHLMIFTHPRCLQCFPTQENSNQRPSTLKLLPLISQVFLSWTTPSKMSWNTLIVHSDRQKLRHAWENCATIFAYDSRYDNLIPKSRHACIKSCHDFAFSKNHTFCQQNRGTILGFTTSQIWRQFTTIS